MKVYRRINFFKVLTDPDESGTPQPFDVAGCFRAIGELDYASRLREWHNDATGCWVDRTTAKEVRVRLGNIRRFGLPPIATGVGDLTTIEVEPDGGLAEMIHMVFRPLGPAGQQELYVAVDYNHHGPRPSRLAIYLHQLAPKLVPRGFRLSALLDQDVSKRLAKLKEITMVELRVKTSELQAAKRNEESIRSSISQIHRQTHAASVGIKLSSPKDGLSNVLSFLRQASKDDATQRLVAKGLAEDGNADKIDLLRGLLVSEYSALRLGAGSTRINYDDAYVKIGKAIETYEAVLLAASPIDLGE